MFDTGCRRFRYLSTHSSAVWLWNMGHVSRVRCVRKAPERWPLESQPGTLQQSSSSNCSDSPNSEPQRLLAEPSASADVHLTILFLGCSESSSESYSLLRFRLIDLAAFKSVETVDFFLRFESLPLRGFLVDFGVEFGRPLLVDGISPTISWWSLDVLGSLSGAKIGGDRSRSGFMLERVFRKLVLSSPLLMALALFKCSSILVTPSFFSRNRSVDSNCSRLLNFTFKLLFTLKLASSGGGTIGWFWLIDDRRRRRADILRSKFWRAMSQNETRDSQVEYSMLSLSMHSFVYTRARENKTKHAKRAQTQHTLPHLWTHPRTQNDAIYLFHWKIFSLFWYQILLKLYFIERNSIVTIPSKYYLK